MLLDQLSSPRSWILDLSPRIQSRFPVKGVLQDPCVTGSPDLASPRKSRFWGASKPWDPIATGSRCTTIRHSSRKDRSMQAMMYSWIWSKELSRLKISRVMQGTALSRDDSLMYLWIECIRSIALLLLQQQLLMVPNRPLLCPAICSISSSHA